MTSEVRAPMEIPTGAIRLSPEAVASAKRRQSRARANRKLWAAILPPILIILFVIIVWEVAVGVTGLRPQVLPAPSRVVAQGWEQLPVILKHASATLQVTLIGFAFSLVIAWILAVAIDFWEWLRRGLLPLLIASQTIPIIAIAPLMIIWFGFGIVPKVLVVALVTFFPIVVGLIEGFSKADREASNMVRSMGAGRIKEFRYVRLPSALPSFFTALRISITYAVVGAIFAEYVGAQEGLGIYMAMQKNTFRTDLVLAAVAVTAILSITLYLLTFLVERIVIPWSFKERRMRNAG
jgi:ABC-type nitrate/sulfonate/bicarbonate transport system permease component